MLFRMFCLTINVVTVKCGSRDGPLETEGGARPNNNVDKLSQPVHFYRETVL